MSTGVRASGRATCTARSASPARRGRLPRGTCGGGSCRRSAASALPLRNSLRQQHPGAPVAAQPERGRVGLELVQVVLGERADRRADGAVLLADDDFDVTLVLTLCEER